ncbi:MAG: alpha/beta hydrolase [Flavobacteriaceae bacterium]|nr:alpha/beta hydrolase [Flavobacteriaceae bacterium]
MKDIQKSTKIINSFEIPKSILVSGKVLQFFSNNLATQFAAKIFSTPLKFKVPERELMMRESAKRKLIKIDAIKKDVMVYTYGYSKKKVLLVHGWAGRGTQLYQIADKILENKMMVVSFDGPAHGLSSGKKVTIIDFIKTIQQIDKEYGPFEAAVGHSFGGMALLNSISKGLKINKLVTIGADNSISEITKNFIKKIELKPKIAIKLEVLFNKKLGVKMEELSSQKNAKNVTIPTLVVHDSEDRFVPVSSAIAIRQNLKNGELLITNGLGHHKIFKDKQIIQRIVNFIK